MPAGLACKSRWMDGTATLTMKKSRTLMKVPVRSTSVVPQYGRLAAAGGATGAAVVLGLDSGLVSVAMCSLLTRVPGQSFEPPPGRPHGRAPAWHAGSAEAGRLSRRPGHQARRERRRHSDPVRRWRAVR